VSLSKPSPVKDEITDGPQAEDLTPIRVESRIQELVDALSKALVTWKKSFGTWKTAEREYDVAFAKAKINVSSDVPYADRGHHATLATVKEREAKDVAEEAFKYSEKCLDATRSALSAWQSINRSVQMAYQNADRI